MRSSVPLLIITICIGMYFMYISPTIGEVRSLSAKKAEYDNVLLKVKELKERRDTILTEYNNIPGEYIEKLNKIIPETFNSTVFANDVDYFATKNGLEITDFIGGNLKTENRGQVVEENVNLFKTNVVTIELNGQYDQFVSFLSELEKSLRLMDVSTLDIKVKEGKDNEIDSLVFKLEVKIYSLR